MKNANRPLEPDPINVSSDCDYDFDALEEGFFANFHESSSGSYSVDDKVPQDPQILSFSSFWLAIQYLSSQPFPISDLTQYAIVFPLQFWKSFPRSHKLDKVPCNIIKIS